MYRVYMTDSVKALASTLAHANGGTEMSVRWLDLIDEKPTDNRTGDEIALDVIQKAGLKWG